MLHDILLILHFIGLGLGLGASLSMVTLAVSSRNMETAQRAQFMTKAMVLSRNGAYGLVLLILTGLGLMALQGFANSFAIGGGALHGKLTLVLVLAGLMGFSQALGKKVRKGDHSAMSKLAVIGPSMVGVTLLIVICAVLAFH